MRDFRKRRVMMCEHVGSESTVALGEGTVPLGRFPYPSIGTISSPICIWKECHVCLLMVSELLNTDLNTLNLSIPIPLPLLMLEKRYTSWIIL
jgi:hypothetical protein